MRYFMAACFLLLLAGPGAGEDGESLFNKRIAVSPWEGETASKGTFEVRHEGEGEPPKTGYFKKHEPGEEAEFHVFVPEGLEEGRRYPLLIVYHGGKDGASGKGMCKGFSKISTTEHPVIVLSPNMYTMDAYNELIAEGTLPIDPHRVVVYGHSSGGMGVRSAMGEYLRTKGAFVPAALISASTTASLGRVKYPPCPYYVMAGEKETPAYVTNEILKERRKICRIHALVMQQAFRDVRYIEVEGSGHSGGTPTHRAVIQHALAVSAWTPPPEDAAAFGAWFDAEVEALAGLTPDADYVERDQAFLRYDRLVAIAKRLGRSLDALDGAETLQAELAARKQYLEIVSAQPSLEMIAKLEAFHEASPTTEYGKNRAREKLLALEEVKVQAAAAAELPDGPPIVNPYYENVKWRVWRDDETPIENVQSMVHDGKKKKPKKITLAPPLPGWRMFPTGPLEAGKPIKWEINRKGSTRFAGVWDDVYASWSGLHGYVRSSWQVTDGSAVNLRPKAHDQFMHFVEVRKTQDLLRCGINFVHQSTTGMCHTILNGYNPQMTLTYEKIYFSDCLVTSPAHASYTEDWADRTRDLVLAHASTLFNSVGSSNSETMAITKMMIVGAYLPPASKLKLKRAGLYPSALLYLWKAGLPFDVPYAHELRHRVAYRALGREDQFVGKYGHAGGERGNLSLEYHRYDEILHMRNMIRMAESLDVLPPEAMFKEVTAEGGESVYDLRKAALVLQEEGQDITVEIETGSYDLADRPLTERWALLYGNHRTTCERGEDPDTWVIHVPWDESLPDGRTAIALVANNGVHDGNPAILTVYRKRGDLPPNGAGPGGYGYDPPRVNRRPVLLGLQDQVVKPGKTLKLVLDAVDPEGQPVRFYKRAGEPGEIAGSVYTLKVPRHPAEEDLSVTIIASDATAGNSYAAKRVAFVVKPEVHAHIDGKTFVGAAPFKVSFSSKGSLPSRGKDVELGWDVYVPVPKGRAADWKKLEHGKTFTHTFEKPGLYEVALEVCRGEVKDRETVKVWVTDGPPPAPVGGIVVEGNGVWIADGDLLPSAFDDTDFGTVAVGERTRHRFLLFNRGGEVLKCLKGTVVLGGPGAKAFRVVQKPATRVPGLGATPFEIEFRPKEAGSRTAEVTVTAGGQVLCFGVRGTGGE